MKQNISKRNDSPCTRFAATHLPPVDERSKIGSAGRNSFGEEFGANSPQQYVDEIICTRINILLISADLKELPLDLKQKGPQGTALSEKSLEPILPSNTSMK
jgi:hypothetical protein